MKSILAAAAALLTLPLAAACSATGDTGSPTALPSADLSTDLVVTVSDGNSEQEFTVQCDPTGGTHPRPESACKFLELAAQWGQDPFAEPPADAVCSQVYGGPQEATVVGTWRGKPVDARFSRTDGCQIERWDNALALLVVRADDGGGGIQPSVTPAAPPETTPR